MFCNNMKQFGICPIRSTCPDRHILKKLDKPPEYIPKLVNFIFKSFFIINYIHLAQ